MKKGFTLVELMGVMLLVAILLIVSVPVLVNTIKKSDTDSIDRIKNDLYLATESYVRHNDEVLSLLESSHLTFVSVQTLIDEEYVSYNNIKDIDNIKFKYVKVMIINDEYSYELSDTNS